MNVAAKIEATEADGFRSAYFDLEEEVRNIAYMAGIAATLAHDALDRRGEPDGDYELIRMTHRDHEQLLFAVQKTHDMAVDLGRVYDANFQRGVGGLTVAAEPDPVFAAIEAHRRAWAADMAAVGRTDAVLAKQESRAVTSVDVEASDLAHEASDAAMDFLRRTAPTTLAGLRAALAYFLERDDDIPRDTRAYLSTALASPLLAGEPAPDGGAPVDPIFAAIEAHRVADKRLTAAHGSGAAPGELRAAEDAEERALGDLRATTPITKAGARALIAYHDQQDCIGLDRDDVEAILARFLAA